MVSKPVAPPWSDSSKNLVRDIVTNSNLFSYNILSVNGFDFNKENVLTEQIYRDSGRYAPALSQNLRVFGRLFQTDNDISIYHFFFEPNIKTLAAAGIITAMKKKKTIHTICSIPDKIKDISRLLFSDAVVVLSDSTFRILKEANVKNLIRIYPGVKIKDEVNIKEYRKSIMKSLGISAEILLLYSGDYEFSGAHETILSAMPKFMNEQPGLKLIFACRAKTAKTPLIEERVKDRVKQMGFADRVFFPGEVQNIEELTGASDIVIFPAMHHHHKMDIPLFLLESIEREKPLIISDIKPLNEIMKDEIGICVKPGDSEELADAILKLSADENLRIEMGKRARNVAINYFNAVEMTKAYEDTYRNIFSMEKAADIKKYYDIESKTYESVRENNYHKLINEIEVSIIKRYLTEGMNVLEAGCGTGLILDSIRDFPAKFTGVDLSGKMLDNANKKGHSVVQGSLQELPFKSNTFDIVYSVKVLPHVKEINDAVNELVRVVKPGGKIMLEFYNAISIRGLRWLLKKYLFSKKRSGNLRETDIYTRYDNISQIKSYFSVNTKIICFHSIISFVPFASVLNNFIIAQFLCRLEKAVFWPFNYFGGFIFFVLEKPDE